MRYSEDVKSKIKPKNITCPPTANSVVCETPAKYQPSLNEARWQESRPHRGFRDLYIEGLF
jgi:hypothetical protein